MGTDARKQPQGGQEYWRSFPQFEALLATGSPELLGKIENTCRQLDSLAQSGSAQEKLRARNAMTAYGRTLELYKQLAEIRNAAAGQAQPDPARQR